MSRLLRVRMRAKRKKPGFNREEGFKHPRLGNKWHAPKGQKSKLRQARKNRGNVPSVGFSSPRAVRFLNPLGMKEVTVHTPSELNKDLKGKALIIAGSVGKKKRFAIKLKAHELGLTVSN